MENETKRVSEGKLLYDPLYAKKPDVKITDDPTKGFFGKAIVKKTAFIILLICFVSLSLFFSFNSISKDLFSFVPSSTAEDGTQTYMLDEYHGGNRNFLTVDFVRGEDNVPDESKPVSEVRRFAVCCDEAVNLIFIGKDVAIIDSKAFYTCKNLYAVLVDEENENYVSLDGVLYAAEDGVPTELVLYPNLNGEYRTALAMGVAAPQDETQTAAFKEAIAALQNADKTVADENGELTRNEFDVKFDAVGAAYVIEPTVTAVGELAFANTENLKDVTVPENLKTIGNLAFFKCHALQQICLADGLVSIGSDAFTECRNAPDIFIPASVESIGHHAFHKCDGVSVVRMECSEEEAENMELGQMWLPQQRKVLMTDIEVSYNETREVQ